MKLGTKLGVALILGVFLVLAGFAYVRFQREIQLFDSDTRRDHRTLGRTLAVAVGQVWEGQGEGAAHELVRRVNATRAEIAIRWVSLDPGAPMEPQPAVGQVAAQKLATDEVAHVVWRDPTDEGEASEILYTYVKAPVPGHSAGAIEIGESLAAKNAYLTSTLRNTVLASLIMAVVCGLMAMAIGAHFVGRPVSRLIEKARRIGAGNMEQSSDESRRDELGELAAELDLMSRRLVEARQRTEEQTAARIATLEQLRHAERLTTVGRLASALAHEVGTPLNVVAGLANMLVKGKTPGGDPTESARVIVAQCERMTRIVRQVLDYARRRPPKTVCADLRDVARGTVELLTPMARRRGVELASDLDTRAVANVDASQIQQALINVIMNAVQASETGGRVTVSLTRTHAPRPGLPNPSAVSVYVVTVADCGAGIPEEIIERLFEPFFTTKPSGEGTGLGLSITKDILEEHGGWISVESKVGDGSRFCLYLPAPAEPCEDTSSSSMMIGPPAA